VALGKVTNGGQPTGTIPLISALDKWDKLQGMASSQWMLKGLPHPLTLCGLINKFWGYNVPYLLPEFGRTHLTGQEGGYCQ